MIELQQQQSTNSNYTLPGLRYNFTLDYTITSEGKHIRS